MSDRHTNNLDSEQAFDRMLESAAPGVRPSDEYRRNLRMMVLYGLEKRQRRAKVNKLVVFCTLCVCTVIAGNQSRLGSDGFDMELSTLADGSPKQQSVLGNERVNVIEYHDIDDFKRFAETFFEKEAAGEYDFDRLVGWTIGGETILDGPRKYEKDGEISWMGNPLNETSDAFKFRYWQFLTMHESTFYESIDSGEAVFLGTEIREFGSVRVKLEKWASYFAGFGEVIYWRGEPVE